MNRWWPALIAGMVSSLVPSLVAAEVVIEQAWVRAMPPTQRMTAAYLTVINRGDGPVKITGASSPLASAAELHESREVDGYTRMERLHQLPLAAGEAVHLSPGGMHLMLMGLEHMPAPGSTVQLCLSLSAGEAVCVDAPVKKDAGTTDHRHH